MLNIITISDMQIKIKHKKEITGEDVEIKEHLYRLIEIQVGPATVEISMGMPQKTKIKAPASFSCSSRIMHRRNSWCTHVYCPTIARMWN